MQVVRRPRSASRDTSHGARRTLSIDRLKAGATKAVAESRACLGQVLRRVLTPYVASKHLQPGVGNHEAHYEKKP